MEAWHGNKLGGNIFHNMVDKVYLGVRNKFWFLFRTHTLGKRLYLLDTISSVKRVSQYLLESLNYFNNKLDDPYYVIVEFLAQDNWSIMIY